MIDPERAPTAAEALLIDYEVWEADMILNGAWDQCGRFDGCVHLTDDLHEKLLQIASRRNALLAGVARPPLLEGIGK